MASPAVSARRQQQPGCTTRPAALEFLAGLGLAKEQETRRSSFSVLDSHKPKFPLKLPLPQTHSRKGALAWAEASSGVLLTCAVEDFRHLTRAKCSVIRGCPFLLGRVAPCVTVDCGPFLTYQRSDFTSLSVHCNCSFSCPTQLRKPSSF